MLFNYFEKESLKDAEFCHQERGDLSSESINTLMGTWYNDLKMCKIRKGHKCNGVEYKEEKWSLSPLKVKISATKLPKKEREEKEKRFSINVSFFYSL